MCMVLGDGAGLAAAEWGGYRILGARCLQHTYFASNWVQVQLSTSSGYISQATAKTFSIANPGLTTNITSMGMALCGYDIPDPSLLQFKAEVSYDSA